jgi:polar amino acid transport system substrate-binding protein
MGRACLLLIAAALLSGCQFPRDTEGTLDRVRGGVMRVGVTHAEPWVKLKGAEPAGVEVELIERFAETLGARVEWVEGSESDLMEALHGRHLDVVIAGLTRRSEWQRVAALTRPYVTYEVVIAAPDRETAERLSEDLEGERIAVEANSPEAAKLEEDTDAEVVPVDDIAAVDGPAAVPEYQLDDLGLVRTDAELDEHEHAMAVSMGENAFLVELERFLLDREAALVGEIRDTVAELDWIEEAAVRARELGHVFSVEVLAVPRDEAHLLDRVEDAVERISALDWKVQDVVVAVVRELDGAAGEVLVRRGAVASARA